MLFIDVITFMQGLLRNILNKIIRFMTKKRYIRKKVGNCTKRDIEVTDNNMCDLFKTQKRSRYKVRCFNCIHYSKNTTCDSLTKIEKIEEDT